MSVADRLSLFFLAALGLVLTGFSVTLYVLGAGHLAWQDSLRLDAALQTLVAAIEVHPGDVEWEPLVRRMPIGDNSALDQVRWAVHDHRGRLVDCSGNLDRGPGLDTDGGWRLRVCRVRAGAFEAERVEDRSEAVRGPLRTAFAGVQAPDAVRLPADRTYHGDGLVLTVAVSDEPTRSTLRFLAWAMAGVSAVIWLTAAAWGRWLCRRALRPIVVMAASAKTIRRQRDGDPLLTIPRTGDELEELGRAFNDLLADLRASLERQRRFTGDASHQLRTPLTAMLGKVDVALRKERAPAEYREVLAAVRRRGEQLQQIIESLLFMARADATAPLPRAEAFDLGIWSRSWLEGWRDHPRAADIIIEPASEPVWVRAQPALLGQALDTLLDNACKYSDAGTPVDVSVQSDGGEAVLAVRDDGCGIDPDEQRLILEPFYRSRQARWLGKPGLGLGLTVVERLLSMMGGRLSVTSAPGRGSTFSIRLPAVEAGGAAVAAETVHPGSPGQIDANGPAGDGTDPAAP